MDIVPSTKNSPPRAKLTAGGRARTFHLFVSETPTFAQPYRRLIMQRALLSLIFFLLGGFSAGAAEELLPPFGFRWSDTTSRVEAVLNGAKAKIVSRDKKENRDVWTVEGLVHPGLQRTLFTFKNGSLFGVELQYEYADRTIEWYNTRMGEIRRYFDGKFGTAKLVSPP